MKQLLQTWGPLVGMVSCLAVMVGVPQCTDLQTKAEAATALLDVDADIQTVQGNVDKMGDKIEKVDAKIDAQGTLTMERLEAMRLELKGDMKDHMKQLGRMLRGHGQ